MKLIVVIMAKEIKIIFLMRVRFKTAKLKRIGKNI
jgi:hypothetical protein